jgi:hypothetical protein
MDIFKEAEKYITNIVSIIDAYDYYTLEYNFFETPENNIVYYENKTNGDVYRSYLSMGFSYNSNHFSSEIHAYIIEQCAHHHIFPKFVAKRHDDMDGSTSCAICFERKH